MRKKATRFLVVISVLVFTGAGVSAILESQPAPEPVQTVCTEEADVWDKDMPLEERIQVQAALLR